MPPFEVQRPTVFNYFTVSRTYLKKLRPKHADLFGCCDSNQWRAEQQPVAGGFRGGYVAATVCRLGILILARLHAGHLTEAELFPACTHTHSRSVSIMTTGATALLIQNTHHRFHSPTGGYVTYVYSNNILFFFFHPPFDLSIFHFKNRSVLCWLIV